MMNALHQNVAILFADISGSTSLYDKLGNEQALQLVTRTLDILTREMSNYEGRLIKTIGDEIMCIFPDATAAITAACAMQLSVEKQRPGGELPIHVRIGLHYGEAILEKGDAYGDSVNIAAHVTALTRARQILTTQAVVDMLPERMQIQARPVMRAGFRGKADTTDVFQFHWEREDTTRTRIGLSAFRKPTGSRKELVLRYHLQVLTLGEQQKNLVMGRSDDCDLVIRNNLASRQHARIEFNFGKFLLIDHSVNGTYIRFSDNQVIMLSHQQIVLHGAGTISFGQAFSEAPTEIVEFILQ
ncbi:MAG: adenylate/guanylate cyclase domain-containing protein [Nitrosomonadales bacterium]|nr:adenylate/guanylate cyclase domain-containing protein [Nitrosomonadales bacterium]